MLEIMIAAGGHVREGELESALDIDIVLPMVVMGKPPLRKYHLASDTTLRYATTKLAIAALLLVGTFLAFWMSTVIISKHIDLPGVWRRFYGIPIPQPLRECHSQDVDYNLTMMSIFKDVKPYLKEWIEFHLLAGFEHFYLYDNESSDMPETVLAEYIRKNMVTLIYFPTRNATSPAGRLENFSQKAALQDAIMRYRCKTKWMALLDTDEYLFSPTGISLPSLLRKYNSYGGVALAWLFFGTSHHVLPPPSLTIEAYQLRAKQNRREWKLIVQPARVALVRDVHEVIFHSGYYLVDERMRPRSVYTNLNVERSYSLFRLHHYFTRSALDWLRRVKRGAVSGPNRLYGFADLRKFNAMNEVRDDSALRYLAPLKKNMRWNGTQWREEYFPLKKLSGELIRPL